MEELLSEETKPETTAPRRRRRPSRKSILSIPLPGFLGRIGGDVKWYFDVRLWSPLILLLLLLAWLPGRKTAPAPVDEVPQAVTEETQPIAETEPAPEPIDPEAEALAVLADSVGAGRSKNVKIIIMWVAVNRSEDRANGYGQSIIDEIARPNQWQGYDPNVKYTEETYRLAKEVLAIRENGDLRPLDEDMLWLVLNDNGSVTVRNMFSVNGNQKWHEKTVK